MRFIVDINYTDRIVVAAEARKVAEALCGIKGVRNVEVFEPRNSLGPLLAESSVTPKITDKKT